MMNFEIKEEKRIIELILLLYNHPIYLEDIS